jgi:hypothetical protein
MHAITQTAMHPSFNYFAGQSSDNYIKIYETKVKVNNVRLAILDLIERKDSAVINAPVMRSVSVFLPMVNSWPLATMTEK